MQFRLIRAGQNHMEDVFRLSNDPVVRAVSIHRDKISWESHQHWFAKKLSDPNCAYYIIEKLDGNFIGQIRFDISDRDAVVNISIEGQFRSKGVARPALLQSIRQVFKEYPRVENIIALIRTDNLNSKNLFEKCGFSYLAHIDIENNAYFKYVLKRALNDL
jgi:UDP-2,4-diacetamido-2,4,6-trideoxy-beta-L-altropyranose hydrolase